jgi:drug/metabolite transporter (DMT)-like permease
MAKEYQGGAGHDALVGVALALGGLICASIANVVQATPAGRKQAVVPLLAWAMLIGAVVDGAMAWGVSGAPVWSGSPRFWAGVGYLAIAGSVMTFPIYFALIRSMGAGRAAFSQVAVPVVAMALSTVFEGYHWTGLAVAGSALALVGLLIALTGRREA